jgi:hypothetical protein
MSPPRPKGTLTVRLDSPGPYIHQRINVIDSTTLQLVASSECNEEIEVPAGTYLVSATLPSGERSVGIAEVAANEPSELVLAATEPAVEPAPPPPPPPPAAPAPGGPEGGLGPAAGAAGAAAERGWLLRFHVQTPQGFQSDDPRVDVLSASEGSAELTVSASGQGILFAQVARPGEIPLNVALPIYGPTSSQSCRLTLGGAAGALTADVSLPDSPRIDAVARYLQSGHLQEAATVTGNAEMLLQQKMADPFGAALGGYALLRSGQLDRLHDWPRNLSDMFPWLPDGAVIAGEEAALEGDHATSIAQVCEAGRRGLPVFAVGFSLLASRLREYSGAPETAFGPNGALVAEAERLLEHVLRVMPFVDFARVSFAFRGERVDDPAASQTPYSPSAGDGWRNVTEV